MSDRPNRMPSDGPNAPTGARPSGSAWPGLRPASRTLDGVPVTSHVGEGYVPCACRDCMEIGLGKPGEALCHACVEADCQPDKECEAPHAYCAGDARFGETWPEVDGKSYCPVCGQEF